MSQLNRAGRKVNALPRGQSGSRQMHASAQRLKIALWRGCDLAQQALTAGGNLCHL